MDTQQTHNCANKDQQDCQALLKAIQPADIMQTKNAHVTLTFELWP